MKQGEKISNLENALQTLIHLPLTICKRTLKRFRKDFAKTKHVVQAWSKMLKMKETIHAYLVSIYIGSIPSNLCTYIMQTSSIMHFYICFGLCWHQSPKRGRLKGKCALGPFLSILVIECQHKCLNVNLCPWMNKVQITSKGMSLSLSTLVLCTNIFV